MTIGKVIRKYRKLANLTQEEMAVRLGVTAPAVNKWEKENSCPDITLLAPIARLLNISLDTLLSFQEDLTEQEIIDLVEQAAQIMKEKSYEEVFRWMKQVLEQYPNCEPLSLNFAAILDAQGIFQGVSEQEKYEVFITSAVCSALAKHTHRKMQIGGTYARGSNAENNRSCN